MNVSHPSTPLKCPRSPPDTPTHHKRLQQARIARLENIKATSPIRKWRFSLFYRVDMASVIGKLSRDSLTCQNRRNLTVSACSLGQRPWIDTYLSGYLLPNKSKKSLAWSHLTLTKGCDGDPHATPVVDSTAGSWYPSPVTPTSLTHVLLSPRKSLRKRASSGPAPPLQSPEGDQSLTDMKREAHLELRRGNYKDRNRFKNITTDQRVQKFLKTQRLSHDLKVMANRGLYISGQSNEKQNLGNVLHISEKYIRDLDMDHDQTCQLPCSIPTPLCILGQIRHTRILTFKSHPTDPTLAFIFQQAIDMVHRLFSDKKIEMDLKQGCIEDDFTVDVLIDVETCQVLAVTEYVFMRKYLWMECLAVSPLYQKSGLGRFMMSRIASVARFRQKSVLLYGLFDVVPFYERLGYMPSTKYLPKPWHIGRFLELTL